MSQHLHMHNSVHIHGIISHILIKFSKPRINIKISKAHISSVLKMHPHQSFRSTKNIQENNEEIRPEP